MRSAQYRVVHQLKDRYSVEALCAYFEFPRSSYYLWLKNGKPDYKAFDWNLAEHITESFKEQPEGYRYHWRQLQRRKNIYYNMKIIHRYMRILGLKSPIRKKKYDSCTQGEINEKARHVYYNVLARRFEASRPNQKLVTDASYVYYKNGRMFLSVIKDLYYNSILAYQLSDFNDNRLVFDHLNLVFNETWDTIQSCILHSDQGFQYTNVQYLRKLDAYDVTISHSEKGNYYDNACCENFFSHLKSESLILHKPETRVV